MDRDFDGEGTDLKERKRKNIDCKLPSTVVRHRAWLDRHKGPRGKGSTAWRPLQLQRVSTKKWLVACDHQIQIMTTLPGLSAFVPNWSDPSWADCNWKSWPHLGLCFDMGPDGNSGAHALQRKNDWKANVTRWCDLGHGCHRDFERALRDMQCMQFWMCMLISWNLRDGPDKDGLRDMQLRATMEHVFETENEKTCALFQEFVHDIYSDKVEAGEVFDGDDSIDRQVWMYLSERYKYRKAGMRCNMSRFLGSLHTAKAALCDWHEDAFERTFCALECDMLHGKALEKVVLHGAAGAGGDDGAVGSTTKNRVTLEDRSLRAGLQNSIVLSLLLLSDKGNQRKVRLIVHHTEHLLSWWTECTKACRSSSETCAYLTGQVCGKFMHHVSTIVASLSEERSLAVGHCWVL